MIILGGQQIPYDFFGKILPDEGRVLCQSSASRASEPPPGSALRDLCDRQFLTTLLNATLWNIA
eukprot:11936159-Karenia_brevis.AAC.1